MLSRECDALMSSNVQKISSGTYAQFADIRTFERELIKLLKNKKKMKWK